jgi:hypothetical protein
VSAGGAPTPSVPPPKGKWKPVPSDLLAVAEAVCGGKGGDYGTSWARAAAFLTRQALEDAIDTIYTGPLLGIRACPTSTKLICLPYYLGEVNLARELHATWAQLSTACHAHPYELDPTVAELQRWIEVVRRLLQVTAPTSAGTK